MCICGREEEAERVFKSSPIKNAIKGAAHGVADFLLGSAHDLQTMMFHVGSGEMELALEERVLMIEAVERSQLSQMKATESWMMDLLSVDPSDTVYRSFRSTTTLGLEVGSLVAGGYGAVKGVIGLRKLVKLPGQVVRISEALSSGAKLNRFHQAARNLSETGQNNRALLR